MLPDKTKNYQALQNANLLCSGASLGRDAHLSFLNSAREIKVSRTLKPSALDFCFNRYVSKNRNVIQKITEVPLKCVGALFFTLSMRRATECFF